MIRQAYEELDDTNVCAPSTTAIDLVNVPADYNARAEPGKEQSPTFLADYTGDIYDTVVPAVGDCLKIF